MCHKVGLDKTSKILEILMVEVGILAWLIMWMDHNSFEVDHKIYLFSATCLQPAFGSPTSHSPRTTCEVCWNKWDGDAMVFNMDGSSLANLRKEGFGGLMRNHDGTFQFGFYGSVGLSNILHAEIQALLVGIRLCWQTGFRKIMCFSYSLHLVKLVTKGTSQFHHYTNKLEIIRNFLAKRLDNISSSHFS